MKKTGLLIIAIFIALSGFSQEFKLTPDGFINLSDSVSKDYTVIEAPGLSKAELYKKVKMYVNRVYNNPKFVSSDIENEQIVIDGRSSKSSMIIFQLSGNNIWHLNYKYDIQFRDGRINFSPYFKYLDNEGDFNKVELIGSSVLGNATGVFNKKGKVLRDKAQTFIENVVNADLEEIKKEILSAEVSKDDNW